MKKSERITRQALLAELFILHLKEEAFRSLFGKEGSDLVSFIEAA